MTAKLSTAEIHLEYLREALKEILDLPKNADDADIIDLVAEIKGAAEYPPDSVPDDAPYAEHLKKYGELNDN